MNKHIIENWEEELENSSNKRFAYFNWLLELKWPSWEICEMWKKND